MSRKAVKYIVVFLTGVVCFSSLAFTAFAKGASGSSSRVSSSSSETGSKTSGSGQTGPVQRESESSTVTVVFNLNGGSGMRTSATVTKGTTVSEFKTPTRKGYQFAGWMVNGTEVSGSMPIRDGTTLTAEWTKEAAPSSKPDSVDTKQQQIEAAASAAEQAVSDPDTLSSQDWSSLLNSSGSGSSVVSSASSQTSSAVVSAGGFSTLFLVGVILVVIGVAGVGTFIYLQFIRGKGGKGGKGGGPNGSGGSGGATDDTIVFTDVSSYSDGRKHDSSSLLGSARQNGPGGNADDMSETKAIPAQGRAREENPVPKRKPAQPHYTEKAQAKPAAGGKSDFDWEKFFNEDGGDKK